MNVSEFDYELPAALVAQEPLAERDASRLMLLERTTGALAHRSFRELPELLQAGDLLVLNDTRVVPARHDARKPSGGRVELLLIERQGGSDAAPIFECLARASHPLQSGAGIALEDGVEASVVEQRGERFLLRFEDAAGAVLSKLEAQGRLPLPPYIRRAPDDPRHALDRERYQTVYARNPGAIAAPTAGLHFTEDVIAAVHARGIELAFVTLHVGLGTFTPVRCERVEDHRLLPERYELPLATSDAVRRTRAGGGRVVAVGTTVVRTLEASAAGGGLVRAGSGSCDLFIHPGYAFQVVDALLTNLHLPRSTLLMLVAALAGRERVLAAYREAVRIGYRFFSYGDAMLIA